jgi:hypothetical protein
VNFYPGVTLLGVVPRLDAESPADGVQSGNRGSNLKDIESVRPLILLLGWDLPGSIRRGSLFFQLYVKITPFPTFLWQPLEGE